MIGWRWYVCAVYGIYIFSFINFCDTCIIPHTNSNTIVQSSRVFFYDYTVYFFSLSKCLIIIMVELQIHCLRTSRTSHRHHHHFYFYSLPSNTKTSTKSNPCRRILHVRFQPEKRESFIIKAGSTLTKTKIKLLFFLFQYGLLLVITPTPGVASGNNLV